LRNKHSKKNIKEALLELIGQFSSRWVRGSTAVLRRSNAWQATPISEVPNPCMRISIINQDLNSIIKLSTRVQARPTFQSRSNAPEKIPENYRPEFRSLGNPIGVKKLRRAVDTD
jgi:hypothetical protein